jgi:Flp pilus assembly protein TadB
MQLERQLPDALDVLTSILEAGATPAQALTAVGHALGPPIGLELERVARGLGLGASTEQAWESSHPVMRPVAAAMIRSSISGAPLAVVLSGASSDARREHRVRVEIAARSAGVRAVAPLAACFLPAFFLIGVAPIIAAFVDQLLRS